MAGIFGFYAFSEGRENWDSKKFIYYGLSSLQGRGQEAASFSVYDHESNSLKWVFGDGLVEDIFERIKQDDVKGFLGIGQVSIEKGDYVIKKVEEPVQLVLVGDGKPALHENRQISFQIFAEMLSERIDEQKDPIHAAKKLIEDVKGGYSFIALTKDQKMICGRDIHGIKPLEVGAIGLDIGAIASESSALDVIGADHSGYIRPGEVVVLDPLSIERKCFSDKPAYCSFEYVYLARPDSYLNSIPVSKVREMIGKRLAEENPAKADAAIRVTDIIIPFAMVELDAIHFSAKVKSRRKGLLPIINYQ
ncbi:MAG: hypothetical protein ACUVTD_04410 [Nitrososphaerales archaeon]